MQHTNQNELGFSHTIVIGLVVILSLVGFAGYRVVSNNDEPTLSIDTTSQQDLADNLDTDLDNIKSIDAIRTLALNESSKAISSIELESSDGRIIYTVYFADGTRKVYDSISGEVLRSDDTSMSDTSSNSTIPAEFKSGISIQQAVTIAKTERPDSILRKIEVEVEDGIVVYSVRFTDGSRVDLSAVDGSIQRIKDESSEDTRKSEGDDKNHDDDSSQNSTSSESPREDRDNAENHNDSSDNSSDDHSDDSNHDEDEDDSNDDKNDDRDRSGRSRDE